MAMSAGEKVGIAVVGTAAAAGLLLLAAKKASTTQTIKLSAQSKSVPIDTADTITAVLTDSSGNPVANQDLTLVVPNTTQSQPTATTNSSGTASWSVTFPIAGTYNIYATS